MSDMKLSDYYEKNLHSVPHVNVSFPDPDCTVSKTWHKLGDYNWMLWLATRSGVLTLEELKAFAKFCANQVCHLRSADYQSKVYSRFSNKTAEDWANLAVSLAEDIAAYPTDSNKLTLIIAGTLCVADYVLKAIQALYSDTLKPQNTEIRLLEIKSERVAYLRKNCKPQFPES